MADIIRVAVLLDIEGDEDDAMHVVDRLLDAGVFQDAINDHDVDDAGELTVKNAVVRLVTDDNCTQSSQYRRLTVLVEEP